MEKSKLEKLILNLELRGGMYISPFNFFSLVAYLDGYNHGLNDGEHTNEFEDFKKWINVKVGKHCSLSWSWIILNNFSDKNKDNALQNLFQLFKDFYDLRRQKGSNFIEDLNQKFEELPLD